MSNIPSQAEVEWAESDCGSLRRAFQRRDNPFCMVIPPVMPEPAMEGQYLRWGQNVCGLWSHQNFLAINGQWVWLEFSEDCYPHPLGENHSTHTRLYE